MSNATTEVVVDNFAGGGGASTGIEQALNRPVDIAINHDPVAVELHRANHPHTTHCCEDIFKVDPLAVARGRRVGFAWFSPDCKHFSKAKGGKPRSKKIRGLAWVVIKWAEAWPVGQRPRVIVLENVEEFQHWGPLLQNGFPCPKRKGQTFKSFIKRLIGLGYQVEWRELRACDYGAPTIRKRLYLIARCDGKPIVWPEPTHGDPAGKTFDSSRLRPWRAAAECIDWSLPCPSIFLTKSEGRALGVKRPLVKATLRRLARGLRKFVIEAAQPFLVQYHSAKRPGDNRISSVCGPLPTQTTEPRFGLAVPFVTEHANSSTQRNFSAKEPLRTQCAEVKGGHFALVAAFLAKFRFESEGASLRKPLPTITAGSFIKRPAGAGHALGIVASHLTKFYGTNIGQKTDEPLHSITAGGNHIAEVRAFLMKYYGEGGQDQSISDPLHTVPTKDRFALVTVEGEPWAIIDLGLRMLVPRELYLCQGFPSTYKIQVMVRVVRKGRIKRIRLSLQAQVRMCGNSVSPPVAAAITAANVPELKA